MSLDSEKKMPEADAVFAKLRETRVPAPPFLETAVLARWRERRLSAARGLVFWKRWALASSGLSLVLLGAFMLSSLTARNPFTAFVHQPFVVRIDLDAVRSGAIAKARIQLPPGVYFEVDEYPELKQRGELTLLWSAIRDWKELPIVLKADAQGSKEIRISFLDADNRVLFQRVVELELKES